MSEALEELRERLERWDELCAQLKELYYKYLDLAAFRSDKCYFPGRKCKRSWDRQYDMGDLTLMWTYIANTAPLCGKLIRALAEVEYKIRLKALESLERYGGVEKKSRPSNEIVNWQLRKPVYSYLVIDGEKLYVIWGEPKGVPHRGRQRSVVLERKILDALLKIKSGIFDELHFNVFNIDHEYERLWLEVPLSESASKLLGGRDKAPVALFRSLGWLLSDDSRVKLVHEAGNPGQVALRLFDWIALVKYATKRLVFDEDKPLVFKLAVRYITKTKIGENPRVYIRPIGFSARVIKETYLRFGIPFGNPKAVIAHGYEVIGVLNNMAIRRHKVESVVDDVNSWMALSATLTSLIIGDGTISPYLIRISAKAKPEGGAARELAKALKVSWHEGKVALWPRLMKLLLPAPPTPAFKKTVKLYKTLLEYPVAVVVNIGGKKYLLNNEKGRFRIGGKKAVELRELLRRVGVEAGYNGRLYIKYKDLMNLAKRGFEVKFLNQMEKEAVKRVPRAVSVPDHETLRRIFEKIAEVARFRTKTYGKHKSIVISLIDKSKFEEVLKLLEASGLRFSVYQKKKMFIIYEQTLVEAILSVVSHLFSAPSLCFSCV
ncbi:hypothetical protein [Pyrobaculum calidifontis]|uniref:Uncharacterized protein n=1 Tax=Pyrobaculum calidifontis (strain DSM 21063 / JCM 11548 / VA1) TaxID=410359 RepID=A3MTB9_PYRCJ|nr:hypothetical protein [Pyrobaculum calidifontis]ABO07886.1 hypothetical protein Pcal_0453 [Pyrobaculum calidifontis JCM 11548]